EIVQRLESGSVPLDESIALYERGEALRKQCQARLDTAQQRIERIVADREGRPGGTTPLDSEV
ncbi:MAG: exodeoxyribonuclease VII small subunit, partial [Erythrobacter sp.]|nr:exodeoxyribonuclease VII small subunit [Erythrobacter sp.]